MQTPIRENQCHPNPESYESILEQKVKEIPPQTPEKILNVISNNSERQSFLEDVLIKLVRFNQNSQKTTESNETESISEHDQNSLQTSPSVQENDSVRMILAPAFTDKEGSLASSILLAESVLFDLIKLSLKQKIVIDQLSEDNSMMEDRIRHVSGLESVKRAPDDLSDHFDTSIGSVELDMMTKPSLHSPHLISAITDLSAISDEVLSDFVHSLIASLTPESEINSNQSSPQFWSVGCSPMNTVSSTPSHSPQSLDATPQSTSETRSRMNVLSSPMDSLFDMTTETRLSEENIASSSPEKSSIGCSPMFFPSPPRDTSESELHTEHPTSSPASIQHNSVGCSPMIFQTPSASPHAAASSPTSSLESLNLGVISLMIEKLCEANVHIADLIDEIRSITNPPKNGFDALPSSSTLSSYLQPGQLSLLFSLGDAEDVSFMKLLNVLAQCCFKFDSETVLKRMTTNFDSSMQRQKRKLLSKREQQQPATTPHTRQTVSFVETPQDDRSALRTPPRQNMTIAIPSSATHSLVLTPRPSQKQTTTLLTEMVSNTIECVLSQCEDLQLTGYITTQLSSFQMLLSGMIFSLKQSESLIQKEANDLYDVTNEIAMVMKDREDTFEKTIDQTLLVVEKLKTKKGFSS
ncbi:hypothetical protein BLNAU_541 [Blattamonas nauphoetae]|uniref:Uncharacterized protein n=1 Tax=Blattamonas nauphoetae TaxID=2049346 RepID=A0ABQ9YM50_9EUKA|nr:hypothetical protein BLNAU_541 [Blattamonas nauphoetae]